MDNPSPSSHEPDPEAHTTPLFMWEEACQFIQAANEIPSYRTPRLTLAAHGIELALKSFLRAKGYTLKQLAGRDLGHSLTAIVDRCESLGMDPPSAEDEDRIRFMSEAHASHEWRYAHTHRPRHMDHYEWITIAEWALGSAMHAVATHHCADSPAKAAAQYVRRMRVDVARALNPEAV